MTKSSKDRLSRTAHEMVQYNVLTHFIKGVAIMNSFPGLLFDCLGGGGVDY